MPPGMLSMGTRFRVRYPQTPLYRAAILERRGGRVLVKADPCCHQCMPTRAQLDATAWSIIDAQVLSFRLPSNFGDLSVKKDYSASNQVLIFNAMSLRRCSR